MDDTERRKLEALLGYWIRHNEEHGKEFREWAKKAEDAGEDSIRDDILQAARKMDEASTALGKALERLGT